MRSFRSQNLHTPRRRRQDPKSNGLGNSKNLADTNPRLKLVAGHCREGKEKWGEYQWCVALDGGIMDPFFEWRFGPRHQQCTCRAEVSVEDQDDSEDQVIRSASPKGAQSPGVTNSFCGHRRAALWQVEQAVPNDDLFSSSIESYDTASPLKPMNPVERMQADYRTQRLTTGPHPMRLMREHLSDLRVAQDLPNICHGEEITIGGVVICRQRPGTAGGVVFISLEDETGVANAVLSPELFERARLVVTQEQFLRITDYIQNRVGLPIVRAEQVDRLCVPFVNGHASHDFH